MATAQNTTKPDANLSRAISRAQKLVADYSIPPIPVEEVARAAGIKVEYRTFTEYPDKVSAVCDFPGRKIMVNLEDPIERRQYAIAHELGHLVLHRDDVLKKKDLYSVLPRYGAPRDTPFEQEAHAFAVELLMPKRLLTPVAKSALPAELARIFKVPRDLMERRLKDA